jgi:hypothetical protein
MAEDRVAAYLSHSYRRDDREVNEFFWKLFWRNGVTFAVDPESEALSVPYLELMMKRSAAFVGIVTRRPEQQTYQCSPFMVFEHGLALQAQKPRLLLVEGGVSKYFFPEGPGTLYFSRQRLPQVKEDAERMINALARRSDANISSFGHGLGRVGLLIDKENGHLGMIRELVENLGFSPVSLDAGVVSKFRTALQLDDLDFIVLDAQSKKLPAWLYPYIRGRFIPTIKLYSESATGQETIFEPPWETGELLKNVARPEGMAVRYGTADSLMRGLAAHVERLREERTLFRTQSEGSRYFRSLSRRRDQVFISNAGEANDFVQHLSSALRRENIRHFQYRYQNNMTLAALWRDELPRMIRESRYFLPLITEGYWNSEFCVEEYELARELAKQGKMTIVPYFLGGPASIDIPEQGRDLSGLAVRGRVRRIVADLDAMLAEEA